MKTANMFFGRFQPFTRAHEDAIQYISGVEGTTFIFSSHTQDKKDNPLSFGEKVEIFDDMASNHTEWEHVHFPNLKKETVNSPADAIRYLGYAGFTKVNLFAGDDRMEKYRDFLKYVGPETSIRKPAWPCIAEMNLISLGDRDPDGEGGPGLSGTKVRKYVRDGNFRVFLSFAPSGLTMKQLERLYNLVKRGQGIDEQYKT